MIQRIITGAALAIGTALLVAIGGIPLRIFIFLIALIACKEILDVTRKVNSLPLLIELVTYGFGGLSILMYSSELMIPSHMFFIYMIVVFMNVVLFEKFSIDQAFILTVMIPLCMTGIRAMYTITSIHGPLDFAFIAFATFGCDTGAYFSGFLFGKHKLIERLSPKKTVEGAIGGSIIGTLLASLVGIIFDIGLTIPQCILLAFILSIMSQFGDLSFSSLKRRYQIKDFSQLLPGHGGVLDRIDSLIFNNVVYVIFFMFLL